MSALENDERTISDALEMMRHGRTVAPRSREIRTYANGRVSVNLYAREAYSYGSHFPLFRHVERNGRAPELFVINGDEWRGPQSRTSAHQELTRRLIGATGVPAVVIPFSALAGAGIDIDSIRPVDVREDETWEETLYAETLEELPANLRAHLDKEWSSVNGPDANGRYSWDVTRHRLGDCLFSAVRAGKRARFLSSFDYNEPRPMYFLVQVPRGAGATVELAIDSLAPRAVWAARARGRQVERQGDIFFVETSLTEVDLYARGVTRRARLTQFDRDARARRGEVGYSAPLSAVERRRMERFVRDDWRRITRDARVKLEYRDAPASGPRTDGGARRRWAKVRESDARDLEVRRAALRAAVLGRAPTFHARDMRERLTTVENRAAANRYGRAAARDSYRRPFSAGPCATVALSMARAAALARFYPGEFGAGADKRRAAVRRALAVYGTAHTAREVVTVRGGAVYVRGKVSHRPALVDGSRDSRAEHVPLELSNDVWYLAVRNRVPRARR